MCAGWFCQTYHLPCSSGRSVLELERTPSLGSQALILFQTWKQAQRGCGWAEVTSGNHCEKLGPKSPVIYFSLYSLTRHFGAPTVCQTLCPMLGIQQQVRLKTYISIPRELLVWTSTWHQPGQAAPRFFHLSLQALCLFKAVAA